MSLMDEQIQRGVVWYSKPFWQERWWRSVDREYFHDLFINNLTHVKRTLSTKSSHCFKVLISRSLNFQRRKVTNFGWQGQGLGIGSFVRRQIRRTCKDYCLSNGGKFCQFPSETLLILSTHFIFWLSCPGDGLTLRPLGPRNSEDQGGESSNNVEELRK